MILILQRQRCTYGGDRLNRFFKVMICWRGLDRRIGSWSQSYGRDLQRQRCKNLQHHEYLGAF
jgi:hypothetical protein